MKVKSNAKRAKVIPRYIVMGTERFSFSCLLPVQSCLTILSHSLEFKFKMDVDELCRIKKKYLRLKAMYYCKKASEYSKG